MNFDSHRCLATENRRRLLDSLLERLIELEVKTDPGGDDSTAENKDLHALEALSTVSEIVEKAAGWAIDHQVGLALRGLEFVPLPPHALRHLPEYEGAMKAADNHQHEANGSKYRGTPIAETATNMRLNPSGGFSSISCE